MPVLAMIRRTCAYVCLAVLAVATNASATIVRMDFGFTFQGQPASALVRLFDTASPESVANFLVYANGEGVADSYDGTLIHRVPEGQFGGPGGFVVQGGGFTFDGVNGTAVPISTAPPIPDEPGGGVPGVSNVRGTISFAKSGPDTVTSQWFVNLGDNSFLDDPSRGDGGFNAFARVLGDGMDLFDAIDTLPRVSLPVAGSATVFNEVPAIPIDGSSSSLLLSSGVIVGVFDDADYGLDGAIDAADYAVWQSTFGSTTEAEADGNGDVIVSAADFSIWRGSVGAAAAVAPISSVPEPATAGCLLLAAAGIAGSRRHR